jgi:hypothetical protein
VSDFEAMQIPHLIQILDRFSEWARYFGIRTCLSSMKREMNKVLKSQTIPALGITVWSSTEQ